MEKRLILAIGLSLGVLLLWSSLMQKLQPIENKNVAHNNTSVLATAQAPLPQVPTSITPTSSGRIIPVELKNATYMFAEDQGAIKEIMFKKYQNYVYQLDQGFSFNSPEIKFKKDYIDAQKVQFTYADNAKKIKKVFNLSNENYAITLDISIENLSNQKIELDLPLYLAFLTAHKDPVEGRFIGVSIATDEKTQIFPLRKDVNVAGSRFVAVHDRYFCAVMQPKEPQLNSVGFISKINGTGFYSGINISPWVVNPGEILKKQFIIYVGPQNSDYISKINNQWITVINYGTFNFISQILLQVLDFLHSLVHNWGVAIILLSIAIYLVLYPLTIKQMSSMKRMQDLQPHIENLRKQYKDNPQKLNKETMDLYRTHKVNPMGGCLPLLLQIPVFFALYQALMRSIDLKGASFLWIKDLSLPDKLFSLQQTFPVIGNEINLLPVLMAIGMFFQQKFTSASQATSSEQQKIMVIVFPVIFCFIFYKMPSGLVLYWFVNSLLTLQYQLRIMRKKQ
jgi:YidC/Oxa1 family membrane protein insertase